MKINAQSLNASRNHSTVNIEDELINKRASSDIKTIKQLRKAIKWQDLRTLTKGQILFNLVLPYPFLLLAWSSAWFGYLGLALFAWFLFFASSFRQAHDGFHNTLGISRKATDILLSWSSALIINNNHAVRQTHMQHHRDPLSEADFEAKFYKLTWWQAILNGANFWFSLQKHGLDMASAKDKQKIKLDFVLMSISVLLAISTQLVFGIDVFIYHVILMFIANSLVGFFAGWLVHHDCHEQGNELAGHEIIARTERNKLINLLTFNLLLHMEHHAFPSIPANNLPKIAQRIDKAAPMMTSLRVVPEVTKTNWAKTGLTGQYFAANLKKNKATNNVGILVHKFNNRNCPLSKS